MLLHGGDPDAHSASGRQPVKLIARAQPVIRCGDGLLISARPRRAPICRYGDELRDGTKRCKVEGGVWTNAVLVALSEIKGRASAVVRHHSRAARPAHHCAPTGDTALTEAARWRNGCANTQAYAQGTAPVTHRDTGRDGKTRKPPRCPIRWGRVYTRQRQQPEDRVYQHLRTLRRRARRPHAAHNQTSSAGYARIMGEARSCCSGRCHEHRVADTGNATPWQSWRAATRPTRQRDTRSRTTTASATQPFDFSGESPVVVIASSGTERTEDVSRCHADLLSRRHLFVRATVSTTAATPLAWPILTTRSTAWGTRGTFHQRGADRRTLDGNRLRRAQPGRVLDRARRHRI